MENAQIHKELIILNDSLKNQPWPKETNVANLSIIYSNLLLLMGHMDKNLSSLLVKRPALVLANEAKIKLDELYGNSDSLFPLSQDSLTKITDNLLKAINLLIFSLTTLVIEW